MDADYEIERLRNWRHDRVEPTLSSLLLKTGKIERDIIKLDDRISRWTKKVNEMAEADKIADAVANAVEKKVANQHRIQLSILQRIGATIVFAIAVCDFFGIHL